MKGYGWDRLAAELCDTRADARKRYTKHPLPCVYCGELTFSRYRVCMAHSDLLFLDPSAPGALDEADATSPNPGPQPGVAGAHHPASASVSSSASRNHTGTCAGGPIAALPVAAAHIGDGSSTANAAASEGALA